MHQFDTSAKLQWTSTLQESLAEELVIKGDYLYLNFKISFAGTDLDRFAKPLRKPEAKFDDDFKYDLQLLVDENFLNEWFLELYEDPSQDFSLTETLKSWLPKGGLKGKASSLGMKALMSVNIWKNWFPTLTDSYGSTRTVDMKCGSSKQSISGYLDNTHVTQVQFHQDDSATFESHF